MNKNTTDSIERLNTDCACLTLDHDALSRATEEVVGDAAFCRDLATTHPHLLSAQPLFLSAGHAQRMQTIIDAIETVACNSSYQTAVLAHAPEIARYQPGPVGVFMGYDFHLGPTGPKLIEINTNAGGALINAYLLEAQRACCADKEAAAAMHGDPRKLFDKFMLSFESEWRHQHRAGPLKSIAIVDRSPKEQYLHPEFILFKRLFETHGLVAVIASPEELSHHHGVLWHDAKRIDLVYNRLTDFDLSQPDSRILRTAYLAGEVVVTPNPRAHALFANKKNLTFLTDEKTLRQWGVAEELIAILLDGIPRTEPVDHADADALWARRGKLFFKPSAGFGGKAAYRGDKITRKVWSDILKEDYVAQDIVPPSARTISIDGRSESLKADLRNYAYEGSVQLVAARLYQGQTTNFRTPGGGFAPVFVSDGSMQVGCR
jgi:hypothetical protein